MRARLPDGALVDQWQSSFELRESGALADTLAAVYASAAEHRSSMEPMASPGTVVAPPARDGVLAMFDAFTGERVIESQMDVETLTPERNGDGLTTIAGPRMRYVTPQMIVGSRQEPSSVTQVTPAPPGSPLAVGGVAPEALISPFSYPWSGYQVSLADVPSDVVVPAGRFHDCWPVEAIMFNSLGASRQFCPGVGYVSHGDGGGSTFYESSLWAELLRWHRATLPVR